MLNRALAITFLGVLMAQSSMASPVALDRAKILSIIGEASKSGGHYHYSESSAGERSRRSANPMDILRSFPYGSSRHLSPQESRAKDKLPAQDSANGCKKKKTRHIYHFIGPFPSERMRESDERMRHYLDSIKKTKVVRKREELGSLPKMQDSSRLFAREESVIDNLFSASRAQVVQEDTSAILDYFKNAGIYHSEDARSGDEADNEDLDNEDEVEALY